MSDIYKPEPRAAEYCGLALNLYRGCDHGCVYCFAPSMVKEKREKHLRVRPLKDEWRSGKKAGKHRGEEVLLSFISDPYNSLDQSMGLTREALEILKGSGVIPVILTKGGMKSARDFHLLQVGKYGATLTFLSEKDSKEWEPGAASPEERIEGLRQAKRRGIYTWVSLEPVIDPEQSLEIVRKTHPFVDHYKVGKLNQHVWAKGIDWKAFREAIVDILERHNKDYYIKKSLREMQ